MQLCCNYKHYICNSNTVALKFKKMKQSRNTVAKTEIQSLLKQSGAALSHSELQTLLNGLCDRVTIYRVLERLIDEELVHKVISIDGVVKFASCHFCSTEHKHNHIHFSCEKCKTVTCISDVEPTYKLPIEYKVKETNFIISGLCPQCS